MQASPDEKGTEFTQWFEASAGIGSVTMKRGYCFTIDKFWICTVLLYDFRVELTIRTLFWRRCPIASPPFSHECDVRIMNAGKIERKIKRMAGFQGSKYLAHLCKDKQLDSWIYSTIETYGLFSLLPFRSLFDGIDGLMDAKETRWTRWYQISTSSTMHSQILFHQKSFLFK